MDAMQGGAPQHLVRKNTTGPPAYNPASNLADAPSPWHHAHARAGATPTLAPTLRHHTCTCPHLAPRPRARRSHPHVDTNIEVPCEAPHPHLPTPGTTPTRAQEPPPRWHQMLRLDPNDLID